jgi:hypothetical protein
MTAQNGSKTHHHDQCLSTVSLRAASVLSGKYV